MITNLQDYYPNNAFVADFIGESNIIDGIMVRDFYAEFAGKGFHCVDKGFLANEKVDVVIRPEDIKLVPFEEGMIEGIVESVIFKGVHYEMIIKGNDIHWMVHSTLMEPVGTKVGMIILPSDIHIMKKVKKE